MLRFRLKHPGLLMVCTLLGVSANAIYIPPEYEHVPLPRLIRNLEAKVTAEPRNVEALVNLARTHAMAYSLKSTHATVIKGEPELGWREETRDWRVPFDRPVATADPSKNQAAKHHLESALELYARAASLAPDDLIVALGHAWLTERSGDTQRAVRMYRELIERESAKYPVPRRALPRPAGDSKIVFVDIIPSLSYGSPLTPEAARYLLPLLDPVRDRTEIAELQESISIINSRPREVSPIAVPLRSGLQAHHLEDPAARVVFDADGSGQRKCWTWITNDAAWLVYRSSGEIDSALQLFGNVTFWLFWNTGYDALAALDDDGDGTLQGNEIAALSLWHDINSNGVSEAGEVQPLTAHGIIALSYQYRRDLQHPDRIAFATSGIKYADGTSRDSYDLVLHGCNRSGELARALGSDTRDH